MIYLSLHIYDFYLEFAAIVQPVVVAGVAVAPLVHVETVPVQTALTFSVAYNIVYKHILSVTVEFTHVHTIFFGTKI